MPILNIEEKTKREKELNELLPFVEGYRFIYNFFSPPTKVDHPKEVNALHYESLKSALHYAAELGDIHRVKKLLENNANINLKEGRKNNTALMFSLFNDNDDVASYLIEKGADVNIGNCNGITPLHVAMSKGKLDIVKLLMSKNTNFYQYDLLYHYTPVMAGIIEKKYDCVEYALSGVNNIDQRDFFGKSLLHLAIEKNQTDLALRLIKHPSANQVITSRDIYGRTSLDIAMAESMDEVINALTGLPKSKFCLDTRYGKKLIRIDQEVLLEKFSQYLQRKGRNHEYLSPNGMCNGLAFIAGCYAVNNQIKEFYSILEKIAQCDFDKISLHDPEQVASLLDYEGDPYTDLDDLFNRFINDITWHQHDQLEKETGIAQAERQKQFEISSNKKILEEFSVALKVTKSQLSSILSYLAEMPGRSILFSGGGHTTESFVLPKKKFSYYDPTLESRPLDFPDADQLSDAIQKIKYQYINTCTKGEYNSDFCENMEIFIAAYQIVRQPNQLVYSDLHQDEEFLMHLLNETNAFYNEEKSNDRLFNESLAIACQAHNPQSVRVLLRYGKHNMSHMEEVFLRSIVNLSNACLIAMLEEGYIVTKKTFEDANRIFQCHINNPSDMDKQRYDKLITILNYYHDHPSHTMSHDLLYIQLIAAIEKNSPEHLSKLLQDQKIINNVWHKLVERAIFLEKKTCLEVLLNKFQFDIEPDLAKIARKLDLIKTAPKLQQ